jgi:hypothetical protein
MTIKIALLRARVAVLTALLWYIEVTHLLLRGWWPVRRHFSVKVGPQWLWRDPYPMDQTGDCALWEREEAYEEQAKRSGRRPRP